MLVERKSSEKRDVGNHQGGATETCRGHRTCEKGEAEGDGGQAEVGMEGGREGGREGEGEGERGGKGR